jgi:hypothetical protein
VYPPEPKGASLRLVQPRETAYIREEAFLRGRNPVADRDRDSWGDLVRQGEAYGE